MFWLARTLRWFFGRLYTDLAWSYDLVAWLASSGHWAEWQHVGLEPLPPGRVLELGPGPGHLLAELAREREAVGIDPSAQMSRRAARRMRAAGKTPRLVRGRAEALPFASGAFDGVLATFPSEYILEPDTAASIARVLRKAGALVIVLSVEVTGRGPLDRLLGLVYRQLGSAGRGAAPQRSQLPAGPFKVEVESVVCATARVQRVVARKVGG